MLCTHDKPVSFRIWVFAMVEMCACICQSSIWGRQSQDNDQKWSCNSTAAGDSQPKRAGRRKPKQAPLRMGTVPAKQPDCTRAPACVPRLQGVKLLRHTKCIDESRLQGNIRERSFNQHSCGESEGSNVDSHVQHIFTNLFSQSVISPVADDESYVNHN